MALDEFIYGKVYSFFKRKKISAEEQERTVMLQDIRDRLTILARACTGNAIDIYTAEREGGYKDNCFFLPASFALMPRYEENLMYYYYRIIYLSIQQKLQLNALYESETLEQSRKNAAQYADEILSLMFQEYPIVQNIYENIRKTIESRCEKDKAPDYTWLYGKTMLNSAAKYEDKTLQHFSDKTPTLHKNEIHTTIHAKAVESITNIEIDKKQQEDYVLTHNFEKVDTADEFDGVWRDFDGDDELESHQNALDELSMKFTVRADDPVHSVYQADFTENTNISDSTNAAADAHFVLYDEWNYAKRNYREKYCKVFVKKYLEQDISFYKKTIAEHGSTLLALRKMLTSINNKRQMQLRQKDGYEFDIDALNDMYTDIISKKTANDAVYIHQRKKEKDIAITLLLDISLSSDGYAKGNRIIDVEKQAAILFGEVLNEFNIDFSVQGFYSKTRNYTYCVLLKDFDENWHSAKLKIGAIQPEGYTRIGAALRHCAAQMQHRQSERKWLILLSDGKPNDYDKYEGKYGIEDVRQALKEMQSSHINAYALAIESQAKYYLPQMFGQNHYQILSHPQELISALVKLYDKIKH